MNSMLTTLLLADASVKKGGPGSGPHPGGGSTKTIRASIRANKLGAKALRSGKASDHQKAAIAHHAASVAFRAEGNQHAAEGHFVAAGAHEEYAAGAH